MDNSNELDDNVLWLSFQEGDPDALGRLMTRHYNALLKYGTKFSRNPDLLRDCIQDVFVELWNRRRSLSQLTAPQVKPYLMTVLRRLIHQEALRNQRISFRPADDDMSAFDVAFTVEEQLIDEEQTRHTVSQINQLLNQLPRRAKEAVYLRFYENLDRTAIAGIMSISEQSVSNLFQEAFRLLRQQIKSEIFWVGLLLTLSV